MKWIKKGHIFKPSGELEWSKGYAQIPRALVLNDRIRIFYATRYFDDKNNPISQTSFIDVDKNDLTKVLYIHNKPVLELGVKGSFSEYGIHPTMLVPYNNSIFFYYQGWQRSNKFPYVTEIGLAKSLDDGFSFTKIGETPVLKKSAFDPFFVNGVFVKEFQNKFYMWYSSGIKWIDNNGKKESVYLIKSATSEDLNNWNLNANFCVPIKVKDECQNSATVISFENKFHMWFCYRPALDFRNTDRGYRIGYAWSEDLVSWTRDDSKVGIDISQEDLWDSKMICYPYIFELDKRIIMLYCGNYFGESGFGYAELKLN